MSLSFHRASRQFDVDSYLMSVVKLLELMPKLLDCDAGNYVVKRLVGSLRYRDSFDALLMSLMDLQKKRAQREKKFQIASW